MPGMNVNQIAAPSSGRAWDPEVGDQIVGTVQLVKMMSPKPNYNRTAQEQEVRIDLLEDQGEVTTIWAVVNSDVEGDGYPSRLARAIADAVRAAGCEDLDEGGRLAVARAADGQPSKPGYSPPKCYVAQYTPPKTSVSLDALGGAPVQAAGTNQVVTPMADPFAGLDGGPVGMVNPQVQPHMVERACAVFGLSPSALAAVTPDGLAEMIKAKGVEPTAAYEMLEALYGSNPIALKAVANTYGGTEPVDPLRALLG